MNKKEAKKLKRTLRNIEKRKGIIKGLKRLTVEDLMNNYEKDELLMLLRHCRINKAHAFYEHDIPTIIEEQTKLMKELEEGQDVREINDC